MNTDPSAVRSAGLLLAGGAFLLFLFAGAAALPLGDSGIAAAAAFSLGAARGPSEPVVSLLGAAAALLPFGEVASRMVFLSALAGACSVWLAWDAGRRLFRAAWGEVGGVGVLAGGAAAALVCAHGGLFRAATGFSTSLPSCVLAALVLAFGVRAFAAESARDERGAGLTTWLGCGLVLGVGLAPFLLLALPLGLLTALRLRRGARWPLYAPFALALGAVVIAYVFVARPGAWPSPRDVGLGLDEWEASGAARRLVSVLRLVERQIGLPALLAAGLGAVVALRRAPAAAALLIVAATGDLAVSALLPSHFGDGGAGLVAGFVLAVLGGLGTGAFARLDLGGGGAADSPNADPPSVTATAASLARGIALCGIALVPPLVGGGGDAARFSRGGAGAAWAGAALSDAPSRSLLLVRGGDLDAGLSYAQQVCGARPDVTVIARDSLDDAARLQAAVRRGGGAALSDERLDAWRVRGRRSRRLEARALVEQLVSRALPERAIGWQPGPDAPPGSTSVSPGVPLFRLEPAGARAQGALPAARPVVLRLEGLLADGRDPAARRVRAGALADLAVAWLDGGDAARASALAEAALRIAPGGAAATAAATRVLAMGAVRRGEAPAALRLIEEVLAREAPDAPTLLLGGRLRLRLGDVSGAEELFERARTFDRTASAPLVGLARAARTRGDDTAARRLLDEALALDPADDEARALIADLARDPPPRP